MPLYDDILNTWREFTVVNGQNPLPIGDPTSGTHNPSKAEIRETLIAILQTMGDEAALDTLITEMRTRRLASTANGSFSGTTFPNGTTTVIHRQSGQVAIWSAMASAPNVATEAHQQDATNQWWERVFQVSDTMPGYSSRAAALAAAPGLPASVTQILVREGASLVIRSRTASADDPLYATGARWGVTLRSPSGTNIQNDMATGRASVSDGAQFQIRAGTEFIIYRRDSSTTQTEVGRYPSAEAVSGVLDELRSFATDLPTEMGPDKLVLAAEDADGLGARIVLRLRDSGLLDLISPVSFRDEVTFDVTPDGMFSESAPETGFPLVIAQEDADGLGSHILLAFDGTSWLGVGSASPDGASSGEVWRFGPRYTVKTETVAGRRDLRALAVLKKNEQDALGYSVARRSWRQLDVSADASEVELTDDDRVIYVDAITGVRRWIPAAGLPNDQGIAARFWTAPKRAVPGARVLSVGDSLTVRLGPDLALFPTVDTLHEGISGATTDGICARIGTEPVFVNVSGGVVPADGSYAAITRITPKPDHPDPMAQGPLAPGGGDITLAGTILGVPVFLRRVGGLATNGYEIARQSPGGAIAVPNGTPFLRDLTNRDDRILILWTGRNDVSGAGNRLALGMTTPQAEADVVIGKVLAAHDALNTLTKQMLFLTPPFGPEDTAAQREMINIITTGMKAALGDWATEGGDCVDTNIIAMDAGPTGLAALAGVTLTSDDLTDIANGIWPRSLRETPYATNLHQNQTADAGLVKLLYEIVLPGKGWL